MHKHQNRMYNRKYTTTGLLAAFLAILKSFTCSGFELSMKASSSSSSPMSNRFVTNKMCPFAQKAWIALECSETPFKMEEISLYGANGKPDWFWKLNPDGTVPVLVAATAKGRSDAIIADSEDILNSFVAGDVIGGNGVLTCDENQEQSLFQKQQWWRDTIQRRVNPIGKSAVLGAGKTKLYDLLHDLNSEVVGPYLCGDRVTVADCAAFPFLWRIHNEFGLDKVNKNSNLLSWLRTCEGNPAFQKTVQNSWWWWW
mmetsp:Transcript_27241/g.33390  ORF Transcript_27241/g.33390 Transcript_27241/m.33390 type:complete len:256 (-) Transcript_27241:350-1117(-)